MALQLPASVPSEADSIDLGDSGTSMRKEHR